jgi:hypothetical protein
MNVFTLMKKYIQIILFILLILFVSNITILSSDKKQIDSEKIIIKNNWYKGTSYWYKGHKINKLVIIECLMKKNNDFIALDMINKSKYFRISGTIMNIFGGIALFKEFGQLSISGHANVLVLSFGLSSILLGELLNNYGKNIRNRSIEHYNDTVAKTNNIRVGLNIYKSIYSNLCIEINLSF